MFPPFWKQDAHWPTVEFSKTYCLDSIEKVCIAAEGRYNLMIDGKLQFGMPGTAILPKGEHRINIKVHNTESPPALYMEGDRLWTDDTWLVTYEDKIWIDENGTAHGSGIYRNAAQWNFHDIDHGPSTYALKREYHSATHVTSKGRGVLVDFGRETMGYLMLRGITGEGCVNIFYGESEEEALDRKYCETLDQLQILPDGIIDNATNYFSERTYDYVMRDSKAFRYVYVETTGSVHIGSISMEYEYSPHDDHPCGSFTCDDDELNRIWDVSAYTMDLTTREFFMDGIKRDRWTWSGDAIQSYLMNYYLRFDSECVKRTIRQLRGKDPVTAHINTIMDYTWYWFKSIHDYYLYTGDLAFVREIFPGMLTLMDYCLGRTNADGMAEGQPDDWIFVDWVDFPMHKRGTLCFEQLLFVKALETMALCAGILRDHPLDDAPQGSLTTADYAAHATRYAALAQELLTKVKATFWSAPHHALLHAIEDGGMNTMVTKFPNMFAIIYGYVDGQEREDILQHVLLNPEVERITTPYMRFYELEALCEAGHYDGLLAEIKSYWGGMLREGATTFWEKYVPSESGRQHLSMYGRPYGKSLCHAWGASPIYIIGKYLLGVRPMKPGYAEYEVCPRLCGLKKMEGVVPTPWGVISVKMDESTITVRSDGGQGTLIIRGRRIPILPGERVVAFH